LLAAVPLLLLLAVGGAYGILVLVTPDAPPPPRFGQDTTPNFAPEIDGRWYAAGCRKLRILGGWLLPGPGLVVGSTRRPVAIDEPTDLTGLRTDGRPRQLRLRAARLSIRWHHSELEIDGTVAGERVHLRLDRHEKKGC
jgi:hypothetical protein